MLCYIIKVADYIVTELRTSVNIKLRKYVIFVGLHKIAIQNLVQISVTHNARFCGERLRALP